jgi:hypothetical protein
MHESDNKVACPFPSRAPVLGPSIESVCHLVRPWLDDCITLHDADCRSTIESNLPSRVIQLSGTVEAPVVKLIETRGIEGAPYCALSHCWGPIDKIPLRTTRENYDKHVAGIPHEQLPKTFRDTVALVLGIGIRYVWIDSLCIIQDDREDWHAQAQDMGAIYRNATLVVAAAGASDSTDGLFISDRPCVRVHKVPYIVAGEIRGAFNLSLHSNGQSPSSGVLATRAWAFQERYLARRTLHFMPGGVYWVCEKMTINEPSVFIDLEFHEKLSWLNLLNVYTEKNLTYPSDRLYALRGPINELQQTRADKFRFDVGIWEDEIVGQILWVQDESIKERESLKISTWSWLATGSRKNWVHSISRVSHIDPLPITLDINDDGFLVATGYLSHSSFVFRRRPLNATSCYLPWHQESIIARESWDDLPGCGNCPCHVIQADTAGKKIMGLAAFDREPVSTVQCFYVALSSRQDTASYDRQVARDEGKIIRALRKLISSERKSVSVNAGYGQYMQDEDTVITNYELDPEDADSSVSELEEESKDWQPRPSASANDPTDAESETLMYPYEYAVSACHYKYVIPYLTNTGCGRACAIARRVDFRLLGFAARARR